MTRSIVVALVFGAIISVTVAAVSSQDETVAARGVLVDESGAPVADAVVSVRHYPASKASVRSAADGSFTIAVPRRSFDGVLLVASDEPGERLGTLIHPDQGRGDDEPVKIVLRKAHKLDVTVADSKGELVTGARVATLYHQQLIAEQTTDEAGRAILRVPPEVQLIVYAVKRDVGFEATRLAPESYEQLRLALQPNHMLRVHVQDDRQQAIAGAKVRPLSIGRSGSPNFSISLYDMEEFVAKTDEAGLGICHVPTGNVAFHPLQIVIEAEAFNRPSVFWMSEESIRRGAKMSGASAVVVSGDEFTINLKPAMTVRGSVVYSDGRPAAGASVGAFGAGHGGAQQVQGAKCDDEGAFQIGLQPGLYYAFIAEAGSERSRDQRRVVIAGRPTAPLKIVLAPARRIHGVLTRGPEKAPVPLEHVGLVWHDDESYSQLPPEERLPAAGSDPGPIVLGIFSNGRTDAQGRFEFLVAAGRYHIGTQSQIIAANSSKDYSALPLVDVTDQAEFHIDLSADSPHSPP